MTSRRTRTTPHDAGGHGRPIEQTSMERACEPSERREVLSPACGDTGQGVIRSVVWDSHADTAAPADLSTAGRFLSQLSEVHRD